MRKLTVIKKPNTLHNSKQIVFMRRWVFMKDNQR